MKQLLLGLLFCTPLFVSAQKQYPVAVEAVLKETPSNRNELEKAIDYFLKEGDSLKIKAIYFLVSNMDIHYSASYYWADSLGKKIAYNELNYLDFGTALQAFDEVKKNTPQIHPKPITYRDIDSIKASYLIDNVERAFAVWKRPWGKEVSFKNFCEYILPYRASVEPLQNWRSTYQQKFDWINDSSKGKTTDDALLYLGSDFKKWFLNTYDIETRKEPLPRLGAMQLLQRKKGPCEDIADLATFALRSQGFQVTNDMVTYWGTSSGSHFCNSTVNSQLQPIRFDASTSTVRLTTFAREPAKVIRTTYSKQPDVVANFEDVHNIPAGFMRTKNYTDVTHEYWETKDVHCPVFDTPAKPRVAYACVFNYSEWRPTWYGKVTNDSVVFTDMSKGVVYLPVYYNNGKRKPAGYPIAVGYNHEMVLAPDTINTHSTKIQQQDKYLVFRSGKNYKLYFWNNSWKLLGEQKATEETRELVFNNVPRNALLLLVPEYSQRKERPFVIMDDGQRLWW